MIERMWSTFSREIDDEKWVTMKSAPTVPFDSPEIGIIAVNIVDHTGVVHDRVVDLNRELGNG